MSNISTIATYLARFSGQLQPMLEKVQAWTAELFLLENRRPACPDQLFGTFRKSRNGSHDLL